MPKGFRHLTRADRLKIEALNKAGLSKIEIAKQIHVHRTTIYNELARGSYEHRNTDWTTEIRYSPDIAEEKYQENLKAKGPGLKIGNDLKLAQYIEHMISEEGYSPEAVLGKIKTSEELNFSVTICTTTLYSYIDKGIFLSITNKDLPVKSDRKRAYHKVRRKQARASAGESIEKRPEEINMRKEFGHWEMDSVIGQRGKSKNSLLVLTERKTRQEIIFKLPDHTSESVVNALDRLEHRWGALFGKIFKTITVDNGSEFADVEGLENSALKDGQKRTKVYYCHPYSSYERGTNEVTNKMVRRKIPKGTNFDHKTEEEIQQIEEWINHYPRRIFGFRSSQELYKEEMEKLV